VRRLHRRLQLKGARLLLLRARPQQVVRTQDGVTVPTTGSLFGKWDEVASGVLAGCFAGVAVRHQRQQAPRFSGLWEQGAHDVAQVERLLLQINDAGFGTRHRIQPQTVGAVNAFQHVPEPLTQL